MKLFTSDSAVYKREAEWVGRGGDKPSLRRIGKRVICTSLRCCGTSRAAAGPGEERAEVALAWRG